MVRSWLARLEAPVSNAFLVAFRMFFGVWMVLRCAWYLASGNLEYVRQTEILFSYRGWEWVPHAPASWFEPIMWLALAAAVLVGVGFWTRVSAAIFALSFGYFFIVDAATWGNVDYLAVLLALILTVVPSGKRLSVDAWRAGERELTAPWWTYRLLQLQLGVVYFYAGVIKCTPDWFFRASPIRIFFEKQNQAVWLAPVLQNDAVVHFLAVGGCLFDLFIVPLLLVRRTRPLAMAMVFFFHGFNFLVLGLGIIPSFMIVSTLVIFSDPDRLEGLLGTVEARWSALEVRGELRPTSRWLMGLVAVFAVLQLLIPWRHLAYPGDARWNGDGQNFSWWMRSIYMNVDAKFYAEYDGQRVRLHPLETISSEQGFMGKDPDLMAQYARHEAAKLRAAGHKDVRIVVEAFASLNDRPRQRFIKENLDLAALPHDFVPEDVVVPLLPYP